MTDTPVPVVRFKPGGAYWIKRLNILLRFARLDPWQLNNDAWEKLLDDLYWALYAAKRDREKKDDEFHRTATREGVRDAQHGLRQQLNQDNPEFKLAEQVLRINANEEIGFYYYFSSDHFPTSIYMMFAYLLEASGVKSSDFRLCANEKCKFPFVPLRKPRKDTPSYCSTKCANVVAARNYRRRETQAKRKEEQERSHKKYKTKVEAKRGRPTRVQRRPRKPK